MPITVIHSAPAWFDVPAFTFLRPQVQPGDHLIAIVVTATPAQVLSPGWETIARSDVDQGLAIYRHVVDGNEPAVMAIVTDSQTVNANACMVFVVQGAAPPGGRYATLAANLYSNGTTSFIAPGAEKANLGDMYLGIVGTNGSSELLFAPPSAVVHANIRDAGYASTQLLVFEVPGGALIGEHVVAAANSQPGFAAALVIPAA